MGIARADQQEYLKTIQVELLAGLLEKLAWSLTMLSGISTLMARALREVTSNRATLKSGKIPLDYEHLLTKIRDEFEEPLLSALERADVVKFDSSRLWLHFKDSSDELSAFWKKRDLEKFLARLYGGDLKIQFRKEC